MGSDLCRIFGRNFDWTTHIALLLFTHPQDDYASISMVDLTYLGFTYKNQPDPKQDEDALLQTAFLPIDGMNEYGLTISLMLISHAEPPYSPSKNTIYTSNVIRLVLDYAKNIDEAISLISNYNIDFQNSKCHFLLAEPSSRSVILKFLNNKIVINNTDAKWQVCTNFIIQGSDVPDNVYCWRYKLAYKKLKNMLRF